MAIRVNGTSFFIETANTMYQMRADAYGVLKHIWYGAKTGDDMEYLLDYHDTAFSGNIYDAGNRRSYSLDTLPQEYPADGNGDYRICAVSAVHQNGSRALDLRYKSHRVIAGKYSISALPAVYECEGDNAETLEITLADISGIEVTLCYGVFPRLDIITRSAVIKNSGSAAAVITRAASMSLDIPYGEWEWMHFHGRHAMEREPERVPLMHGIQESSSSRGTSSHQQNPSVILCRPDCTETAGECTGAMLLYSGGFETRIEKSQFEQIRMTMGIDARTFEWHLDSGEEFFTPEAAMSYSTGGFERLSHNFHRLVRSNICRGKYKTAERPVLINNWEATYFNFNSDKLVELAESAAELGVDMLVLDDGWFGKRDHDTTSLGDWYVDTRKLPEGLHDFVKRIKNTGLKFGIWIEPEMVSEDSDLYRAHPDWAIAIPERKPVRGRGQLVLDMSRAEVREYLYNSISGLLKSADISYIKWDMNRSITSWYSSALTAERQGEMPHRYVLGLYELLERLTTEFPDVLFEGCSGGGGRFDAGMLYYCPQIWTSDNTDAYDRTLIQYGTSFFYPVSTMGAHISAVPNHQSGRTTPMAARAAAAMAGSFGFELDVTKLSSEERQEIKEYTAKFKQYRKLIHGGDYYRLSNPAKGEYAIWEFAAADKSEALVSGIVFRARANALCYNIKLRGLDPEKQYRINGGEHIYTGKALMTGGVIIPRERGDYYAVEMHFREVRDEI